MSFGKDLSRGKKTEQQLIDFLEQCGYNAKINDNEQEYSFYDIIIENPRTTFEVKSDFKSSITGNLAVEFYNPKLGKASGVEISKADFWCHMVYINKTPTLYFCLLSELLEFIKNNPPYKVCDVGGDNNASLYLYKKDFILGGSESNRPLKNYSIEQFKKIMEKR